jgi:hypothetical protein
MSGTLLFSPMTIRAGAADASIFGRKGFPTDWHLMNAGKFAAGGAGLVVVESTKVERRGCGTVGDLGIWDDGFVEPLSVSSHSSAAEFGCGQSQSLTKANVVLTTPVRIPILIRARLVIVVRYLLVADRRPNRCIGKTRADTLRIALVGANNGMPSVMHCRGISSSRQSD